MYYIIQKNNLNSKKHLIYKGYFGFSRFDHFLLIIYQKL